MNTSQQSARIGSFHNVPYPQPGRENQPVDRPAESKTLTVDFSQEVKDRFTGHELIIWVDGAITGILRPPRKPVSVDVGKLARMIAQTEHKITNVHLPEIEKLKKKNLFSEVEKIQRVIDGSKANISAWKRETETAEESEREYGEALKELNVKIKNVVK